MTRYCHEPGCETAEYDDAEFMCSVHNIDLVADQPTGARSEAQPDDEGRTSGSGRSWNSDTCWNCGEPSLNPENVDCVDCAEALVPPRLLLTVGTSRVPLKPGESVLVGREGRYAHLFRDNDNVSRQHATVGVDPDGTAWIEPVETSLNGTFRLADTVEELDPGRRHRLSDGETLRFARDVSASVQVYALPNT